MARGMSGSLTRTISRNIMLMSASAVVTTISIMRASRSGSSGFGMPAMSEPTMTSTVPATIALTAPASVKPRISSSLRIGVTR